MLTADQQAKHLFTTSLMPKYFLLSVFLTFGCGDYPASEKSEDAPIDIKIDIRNDNSISHPDNETDDVDINVDSQSESDAESQSESKSDTTIDNTTGLIYYEFKMID